VQRDGLRLRTIGVNATLWADAGASAVQELAFALATGIDYLRAMAGRRLHVDVAGPRVLFTFSLGSNLFMEIAKLRAARLIWARAIEAADGGAAAQRLECHGRTSRWNKTVLDPHVNLLRTTTEAFAGVVGGCSGLDIGTFDEECRATDAFSRRLARNIQIILGEECQLGRVIDPAGGSWYVETLTRQLAAKAWGLFQEIMRKGGMAAAIQAGYPQSLVDTTARERITAVEQRREVVIGTNLHPNPRDTLPPVVPSAGFVANDSSLAGAKARAAFAPLDIHDREQLPMALQEAFLRGISLADAVDALAGGSVPPPTVTVVAPRRRAEPFEALRRRSQAHQSRTGERPKVFLATLGPRKQHGARADFSTSFFAAGGFDVVSGKAFETPAAAAEAALASGARVVVICSTDETYPTLVPPLAHALKAAGPPPLVILAGLPATPELQTQFKAAGIDEFIHLRANCAKVLAAIQDRIGLATDTPLRP
jgi:methylmalonyl-CoA mutase